MEKRFEGKAVMIIGASGGLGASFAKAFGEEGAKLLLIGRNEEKLKKVSNEIDGDTTISTVDIRDTKSVENLKSFAVSWSDNIDIVVNVSGYDVRKSLDNHSYEEIKETLDINLLGAILTTKAFLPYMRRQKGSTIVHIGGFADGRMAFPYYSVDVASRAGIFSFIEAINRELKSEGNETRLTYFCPSPADTDAERPFHPLWRNMKISIVPVEKVAETLLRTIEKNMTVSIMGGFATVLFAKLNSILPKVADVLLMNKYGKMLKEFLQGMKEEGNKKCQ